ncbi:MAG: DUF6456 domain-containing protein [Rhizomicrobium sp.]
MSLGGEALQREAKRLLRQMLGGAVLQRVEGGGFLLIRGAQKPKSTPSSRQIEAELVTAFAARGLLQADAAGAYRISPAGCAWLQRLGLAGTVQEAYADQHRNMIVADIAEPSGGPVRHSINANAAPLTFLCQRGLIDATERAAGERLARDFYLAQLTSRLTADWQAPMTRGRRSAPSAVPEAVLAAKQRLREALAAVGPELSGVLMDLCCLEQGLEVTEKRLGWPRASAKVVLRLALDRLARHYGLGVGRQSAPIEVWRPEKEQC